MCQRITPLADDLHCHRSVCVKLTLARKMLFILTCKESSCKTLHEEGGVSVWGRFYFLAGRITNPPWGAPLRSRIRNPAGFTMPAPILKRIPFSQRVFLFNSWWPFSSIRLSDSVNSAQNESEEQDIRYLNPPQLLDVQMPARRPVECAPQMFDGRRKQRQPGPRRRPGVDDL